MNQPAASKRILIIDDDPRLCRTLERFLSLQGFLVECRHSGAELLEAIDRFQPSVVLLDLGLPDDHGFDVTKRLRGENSNIGLIIVTGSSSGVDEIVGLELGADDYVAKPVNERELLARIRSTLRRVEQVDLKPEPAVPEGVRIDVGSLILDLDAYEAMTKDGVRLDLTTHEFQTLTLFARNRGRVLTRDQILDRTSHRGWVPYDRSVDVAVGKLRRKLRAAGVKDSILTVRGAGYKFVTS